MAASFLAPAISPAIEPGAYLTDGYHLFAILSVTAGGRRQALVTYEDCRTLELLACPADELSRRHLELVRAAPG